MNTKMRLQNGGRFISTTIWYHLRQRHKKANMVRFLNIRFQQQIKKDIM